MTIELLLIGFFSLSVMLFFIGRACYYLFDFFESSADESDWLKDNVAALLASLVLSILFLILNSLLLFSLGYDKGMTEGINKGRDGTPIAIEELLDEQDQVYHVLWQQPEEDRFLLVVKSAEGKNIFLISSIEQPPEFSIINIPASKDIRPSVNGETKIETVVHLPATVESQ